MSGRRSYDSPVRRQQSAATRDRIVAAGAELLHGLPVWDWRGLTVRAVAERAGVAERTVYRHFGTERGLRDAVLSHMEQESGVELDDLTLDRVADVAGRILEYVARFPRAPRTPPDPTMASATARQRAALLQAVTAAASPGWSDADRVRAAALLDVLWSPVSFERLVDDWGQEPDDAIAAVTWLIGLLTQAIEAGPPGAPGSGRRQRAEVWTSTRASIASRSAGAG